MACNSWASDAGCVQVDGCPDYCSGITNTQLHAGGDGCPDQVVLTFGLAVYGDGGSGKWYWDASQDKENADYGTIIDTSVALSVAAQGTGSGTGCWVREFAGPINAKWYGATGDGSTDDTVALQAAIDVMTHAKETDVILAPNRAHLYVPAGKYIFSQLKFYDPAQQSRGNWTFQGAGSFSGSYPAYNKDGTQFRSTLSTDDAFIVNEVVGTFGGTFDRDTTDHSTSMKSVTLKDFSLWTNATGSYAGMKCERMIRHSKISNVSILNGGDGIGLLLWSCYESAYEDMLIVGTGRTGTGIYMDTERGAGAMLRFQHISIEQVDTCLHIGPSIAAAYVGGAGNSTFTNVQFHHCWTGLYLGWGASRIILQNCFMEYCSETGIILTDNADVAIHGGSIGAGRSEYNTDGDPEGDSAIQIITGPKTNSDISRAERVVMRDTTLSFMGQDAHTPVTPVWGDPRGIRIPENSYAVVDLKNVIYSFGNERRIKMLILPDVFNGRISLEDVTVNWVNTGLATQYRSREELIHDKYYFIDSLDLFPEEYHTANVDINYRRTYPTQLIVDTTAGDVYVYLPKYPERLIKGGHSITIKKLDAVNKLYINVGSTPYVNKINTYNSVTNVTAEGYYTCTPFLVTGGFIDWKMETYAVVTR